MLKEGKFVNSRYNKGYLSVKNGKYWVKGLAGVRPRGETFPYETELSTPPPPAIMIYVVSQKESATLFCCSRRRYIMYNVTLLFTTRTCCKTIARH